MKDRYIDDAVGALAAGVAHEINNPLAFVLANLSFALDQLGRLQKNGADPAFRQSLADVCEALEDAVQGGARVKSIVQTLTTYSEQAADEIEAVNLKAVVMAALDLTRRRIQQQARLVTRIADVGEIEGNSGQLLQALTGVLLNASEAVPDGAPEEHEIRVILEDCGDRVVFTVADTGEGIEPSRHERVFEPFVTSRESTNQSGLGLSMCQGVVTGLGGRIELESDSGHGATFRITLPRNQASADEQPAPQPSRARVLVIDDETLVCRAVARTLGKEHDVDVAESGREGLGRLLAGSDNYDVVLCDLIMPEMTGMELYRELMTKAPGQVEKIVFLTGGAATQRARTFLAEVKNQKLDKPFEPNELRELVREMVS